MARRRLALPAALAGILVLTACLAQSDLRSLPSPRPVTPVAGAAAGTAPRTASTPSPEPPGASRPASRSGVKTAPPPASAPGSPTGSPSPRAGTGPNGSAGTTGTQAVALTFDDGPDPYQTPRLLDLLKQYGVKATFCVVGFRARDNPALIKRIVAEGHTLCNHSWQHLVDLAKRPASYIEWDLRSTNEAIRAAVPGAQIRYFRAPGGNFTPALMQRAREMGMVSIGWDVDPRDWDRQSYGSGAPMVNHIGAVLRGAVRPGSIVLSHDLNKPDTIIAYNLLLPWLTRQFTLIAMPTEPTRPDRRGPGRGDLPSPTPR